MAAPNLYERAATSMEATPLVRVVFGVLVAMGLYLSYVGWLAKPASAIGKPMRTANDPEPWRAF